MTKIYPALSGKFIKQWLYLAVEVIVLLAIIIFIDIVSNNHNKIFDLNPVKRFTISNQGEKILNGISKDIRLIVFYEKGERANFNEFLRHYSYLSPHFSYSLVDLDRNPAKAKKYGIVAYGEAVLECGKRKKKIQYPSEEHILNAIIKVTREKKKVIYFLKGHGENNPFNSDEKKGYSLLNGALKQENYAVKPLELERKEQVPQDASVLVISGPKKDLFEEELAILSEFFMRGGKLLFMIDPYTVPELVEFLKSYGIMAGDDIIIDKGNRFLGGDFLTIIAPFYYKKHPITKGFDMGVVFPLARSVKVAEASHPTVSGISLVKTAPESWAAAGDHINLNKEVNFQKGKDAKGPVSVVVLAEVIKNKGAELKNMEIPSEKQRKNNPAICVFGDSDFVNNFYFNLLGNRDLFLNVISWLAEEEDLISIRPESKQATVISPFVMTSTQGKMIFWFLVIIEPALILLIGIAIYVRRRIKG